MKHAIMKYGRLESINIFHVVVFLLGITVGTNGIQPQPNEDYNDIQMREEDMNRLTYESMTTVSPPVPTTINYDSFLKRVSGPLTEKGFEYMLDYYNNKSSIALELLHDFDSKNISRMLVDSAIRWNTTPVQFLEEMTDLISMEKEQRSNAKGIYGAGPEKRLAFLKKKYNVSAECAVPDCVSISRITLVFPHLGLIEEKPISVHKEKEDCLSSDAVIDVEPNVLRNPLFGGIIPVIDRISPNLNSDEIKKIVTVHLFYSQDVLYGNETVPIRTQCIMLYRRMKKSLLSKGRKIRLLKLYDVIGEQAYGYNGKIRDGIETAYDHISKDFKDSVALWLYNYNN